jgi:hypothetical protein
MPAGHMPRRRRGDIAAIAANIEPDTEFGADIVADHDPRMPEVNVFATPACYRAPGIG